jgi:hypothetical protein
MLSNQASRALDDFEVAWKAGHDEKDPLRSVIGLRDALDKVADLLAQAAGEDLKL